MSFSTGDIPQINVPQSSATSNQGIAPLIQFSDVVTEAVADAKAAYTARTTGQPRGPISGLRCLDREIGGALSCGLHSIGGDPGAGKSAFGLQIASTGIFPALFVTCEMAPAELIRRQAARVTNTFLGRYKSGEMPPVEAAKHYQQAWESAPQLALLDATKAPAPPQHIQDCAKVLLKRHQAETLLIVVDSLHSWVESMSPQCTEYEALNLGLARLRTIAHELRCPIVYITERNRESTKSGSSGMNTGAGSRKIEYGAETVINLMRDSQAIADSNGEIPVTLKLAKNRHGAPGKEIHLTFNGALQRFSERADH